MMEAMSVCSEQKKKPIVLREITVPIRLRGSLRMLVSDAVADEWTPELMRKMAVEELAVIGGALDLRGVAILPDLDAAEIGEVCISDQALIVA